MRNRSWASVLLLVLVVAIASFALGLYFGPIARNRPAVEQAPTRFFTNFNPERHLEDATEGKLDWVVVDDEPVTGEHYGNPPHSRQYARRKTRLVATVTPEEWQKLKTGWLHNIFSNQGNEVELHGEDPGGGRFTFWRIDPDAERNDTAPHHGFGYRYYGGARGVGSHHGLFTFSLVKADDRVEVVFFIWESWPRTE
jgi:hypothetical protein